MLSATVTQLLALPRGRMTTYCQAPLSILSAHALCQRYDEPDDQRIRTRALALQKR